jgi:hypothetical protein
MVQCGASCFPITPSAFVAINHLADFITLSMYPNEKYCDQWFSLRGHYEPVDLLRSEPSEWQETNHADI